jgi:hypothetical protein
VKADAQIIQVGPIQDSVSQNRGSQDGLTFCGQRLYRIVDEASVSSFLSIDDQALVLLPTSSADEGIYTVEIEVSLQDFPAIKQVAAITVQVNPCQVSSFDSSITNTPLSYSVNTAATVGAFYSFSQVRACGYDETITVTGLPASATHDEVGKSFSV